MDGTCGPNDVSNSVFVYDTPVRQRNTIKAQAPNPKTHYNYLFIRTQQEEGNTKPLVVPPPKEQTLVYLLNKRPKEPEQQPIVEVPFTPSRPGVFYVDYREGDNIQLPGGVDLQAALNQASPTSASHFLDTSHNVGQLSSDGVKGDHLPGSETQIGMRYRRSKATAAKDDYFNDDNIDDPIFRLATSGSERNTVNFPADSLLNRGFINVAKTTQENMLKNEISRVSFDIHNAHVQHREQVSSAPIPATHETHEVSSYTSIGPQENHFNNNPPQNAVHASNLISGTNDVPKQPISSIIQQIVKNNEGSVSSQFPQSVHFLNNHNEGPFSHQFSKPQKSLTNSNVNKETVQTRNPVSQKVVDNINPHSNIGGHLGPPGHLKQKAPVQNLEHNLSQQQPLVDQIHANIKASALRHQPKFRANHDPSQTFIENNIMDTILRNSHRISGNSDFSSQFKSKDEAVVNLLAKDDFKTEFSHGASLATASNVIQKNLNNVEFLNTFEMNFPKAPGNDW